jgi:hypothetical protein
VVEDLGEAEDVVEVEDVVVEAVLLARDVYLFIAINISNKVK